MKRNHVLIVCTALMLAFCLLAGGVAAHPALAEAEAEQAEGNLILQVIKHLKTVDWKELPGEIKERIDEAGWKDLQEKLKNLDWQGALDKIKSFFTETEWGKVGQEIERLFKEMIQKGADGFASLEEYLSRFNLDDFVQTLESAANQAAQTVKGWAEQAESAVTDAVETVEEVVSNLLDQLGIFGN